MRAIQRLTAGGALALAAALGVGAAAPAVADPTPAWDDIVRQTLAPGDGWGSVGSGVTGGSSAATVTDVTSWDELRAAVAAPGPHLIVVHGTIRAFGFDDPASGLPTCSDFAAATPVLDGVPGHTFSMDEYRATYDPAGAWGRTDPSGPLETARSRAAVAQTAQVRLTIPSDTTLIGTDDAHIIGAHLLVQNTSNVILRNLRVSDAYDCFPAWDPGDGSSGNWNSLYDTISVMTSTNVWVDHVTLDDGEHPAASLPHYFGRKFEVHDGLLDITHSSDLVTVSWSVLEHHDKTTLVGSSDSRVAQDTGKLRVTFHHNRWTDIGQRGPRVRFGDVDVYNSLYEVTDPASFEYLWGAGVDSSLVVQDVAVELAAGVSPASIIRAYGGTRLSATGVLVNGAASDPVALYNGSSVGVATPLSPTARWVPTLRTEMTPLAEVAQVVRAGAGSGHLEPMKAPSGGSNTSGAGTTALADQPITAASGPFGELAATGTDAGPATIIAALAALIALAGMTAALVARRRPRTRSL